jgi:GNAT superfamily N-acetyltransferase
MDALIRPELRADVPAMQRVRAAVRENVLVSTVITDADVIEAIEVTGRGWVAEAAGGIVGFAVGNAQTGNIWALFLDPEFERRGIGRRLHDTMLDWLWAQGLDRLWLSTEPATRAERFYAAAGWRRAGLTASGEVRFERERPGPAAS